MRQKPLYTRIPRRIIAKETEATVAPHKGSHQMIAKERFSFTALHVKGHPRDTHFVTLIAFGTCTTHMGVACTLRAYHS